MNSTFVGFAPVDRPRACVLVTLQHPKGAHYGGTVAAPATGRILHRALAYLRVPRRDAPPPLAGTIEDNECP